MSQRGALEAPFNPADPACWVARGRASHHADMLAAAWRDLPDLAPEASLEARMARTRARVARLRPLHAAIQDETDRQRQAENFAFAERQIAAGSLDERYGAILRGRDAHRFGWHDAVAFADGLYAARAGWNARYPLAAADPGADARMRAYRVGFLEGGGDPGDIFDAARRSLTADGLACVDVERSSGRLLPSAWPKPSDQPSPVSWVRRLVIVGAQEIAQNLLGAIAMIEATPGSSLATILIVGPGHDLNLPADRDYDDILLIADGVDLHAADAQARCLPMARNCERTRNSMLQQRAQLRLWLARGRLPGTQPAGGHIRWSKATAGLKARLGEFTARYVGPAIPRGHRIVVEDVMGVPATGYHTADGRLLDPETVISAQARLRGEMTTQLRLFAAALRF